jgi:hypothetical protein
MDNQEINYLSDLLRNTWCGSWSKEELPRLVEEQQRKPISAPIEIEINCNELNHCLDKEYEDLYRKYADKVQYELFKIIKPDIVSFKKSIELESDCEFYLRNTLMWCFCTQSLISNKYRGPDFEYLSKQYVHTNEKLSKVLKHLLCPDIYEQFIEEYKEIRNKTKNHNETLVISNRAVDFLTASVNDYDWSSCLHLEDGEFRAGTLVALNSPHYLIAYVKGANPLFDGIDDKKWRQFIYVSEEAIIPIKGYPYHSIEMEKIIVRELLKIFPDREYITKFTTAEQGNLSIVNDDKGFFYNDLRVNPKMEHFIAVSPSFNKEPHTLYANGEALCLNCGDPVYAEHSLRCAPCDGMVKCAHCGSYEYSDDIYQTEDGVGLCYYCYREETVLCEHCGEVYYFDDKLEHNVDINNNIYYNICIECKEFLENSIDEERN